jgi:hypothetical protein
LNDIPLWVRIVADDPTRGGTMTITWHTDLEAATAAAKATHRPLFIDFWSHG